MLSVAFFIIMLSVFMLSVIMLNVVMLSVVMLSVVMLSVVMLSVVMLSVVMVSVFILSVIMLSVVGPYLWHAPTVAKASTIQRSVCRTFLLLNCSFMCGQIHYNQCYEFSHTLLFSLVQT